MKPIIALLLLFAMTAAHAQQPKRPAQALPPIEPAQVAPSTQPVPPGVPSPREIEKLVNDTVQGALGAAGVSVDDTVANALRIAQRAAAPALRDAEAQLQDLHSYVYSTSSGTSRGNRSLVIQTSEPDPVANVNAEEDLNIMSRILRKAVGSSQDERRMRPMGIDVDGSVFGSASGARNIYLDGYGAVFLLTVKYPLIAPDEKREEVKVKETISDEWKEARDEELQSRPGGAGGYGSAGGGFAQNWMWNSNGRAPAEDFDADKVDKLKTSLLESLKNATHIRILKPNDYVTVVVQGAEAVRVESAKRKTAPTATTPAAGKPAPPDSDNKPGAPGAPGAPTKVVVKSSRNRTSLGETVMTIRVKKSDVDAFAQGKLDVDAFRKKASLQAYFRRTDSTSASAFAPVVR